MSNIAGFTAPGFEPVADAFEENFNQGLELGAGFAAYIGNELIIDLTGGWADRRKIKAWDEHTLTPVYSTTKPIGALTACMALWDKLGEQTYETPVSEVWPEFAAEGKDSLTIGQMLSHQGGLVGFTSKIDPELWFDTHALADALAKQKPMWPPGEGSGYHPLTWGYLIGELVWRVTGTSLGTHLRDRITNADKARSDREVIDFWIGTPESEHARCADIQRPTSPPELGEINEFRQVAFLNPWASPKRGGADWRSLEIPSSNGHGTARSVARLFSAYANNGMIGDNPVCTAPGQFTALTQRRCLGEDRVLPYTMEFTAGLMRNNNRIYGPNTDTLGHAGWGGSCGFGDPDRNLSVAYVMNRQSNQLQTDQRAQNLIAAIYGCL